YWFNKYPTETTEGAKTAKREDDLWEVGAGLSYKLPRRGTVDLDYTYTEKSSNFDTYDYKNNRVSVAYKIEF
ncbi:MAG: outer membrane beta-barrel protein, partial [Candidatus Omnitrophica bacterium]|nr:outer membrane beta-barrel protein [Candidatus Omnitrophota bacterium]